MGSSRNVNKDLPLSIDDAETANLEDTAVTPLLSQKYLHMNNAGQKDSPLGSQSSLTRPIDP